MLKPRGSDLTKLFLSSEIVSSIFLFSGVSIICPALFAIASRRTSLGDIALFIQEETGKVSKYMNTLLESKVVAKKTTFNGNKKNNYYVIADPLLRFWYKVVYPNQSRIVTNPDMVFEEIQPDLHQAVQLGFE